MMVSASKKCGFCNGKRGDELQSEKKHWKGTISHYETKFWNQRGCSAYRGSVDAEVWLGDGQSFHVVHTSGMGRGRWVIE